MSLLYSSMLIHGFLPDTMMITVIAPIIKNKAGDFTDLFDNNNYRPIALTRLPSKAKAQMASEGKHWLIERPTILIYV